MGKLCCLFLLAFMAEGITDIGYELDKFDYLKQRNKKSVAVNAATSHSNSFGPFTTTDTNTFTKDGISKSVSNSKATDVGYIYPKGTYYQAMQRLYNQYMNGGEDHGQEYLEQAAVQLTGGSSPTGSSYMDYARALLNNRLTGDQYQEFRDKFLNRDRERENQEYLQSYYEDLFNQYSQNEQNVIEALTPTEDSTNPSQRESESAKLVVETDTPVVGTQEQTAPTAVAGPKPDTQNSGPQIAQLEQASQMNVVQAPMESTVQPELGKQMEVDVVEELEQSNNVVPITNSVAPSLGQLDSYLQKVLLSDSLSPTSLSQQLQEVHEMNVQERLGNQTVEEVLEQLLKQAGRIEVVSSYLIKWLLLPLRHHFLNADGTFKKDLPVETTESAWDDMQEAKSQNGYPIKTMVSSTPETRPEVASAPIVSATPEIASEEISAPVVSSTTEMTFEEAEAPAQVAMVSQNNIEQTMKENSIFSTVGQTPASTMADSSENVEAPPQQAMGNAQITEEDSSITQENAAKPDEEDTASSSDQGQLVGGTVISPPGTTTITKVEKANFNRKVEETFTQQEYDEMINGGSQESSSNTQAVESDVGGRVQQSAFDSDFEQYDATPQLREALDQGVQGQHQFNQGGFQGQQQFNQGGQVQEQFVEGQGDDVPTPVVYRTRRTGYSVDSTQGTGSDDTEQRLLQEERRRMMEEARRSRTPYGPPIDNIIPPLRQFEDPRQYQRDPYNRAANDFFDPMSGPPYGRNRPVSRPQAQMIFDPRFNEGEMRLEGAPYGRPMRFKADSRSGPYGGYQGGYYEDAPTRAPRLPQRPRDAYNDYISRRDEVPFELPGPREQYVDPPRNFVRPNFEDDVARLRVPYDQVPRRFQVLGNTFSDPSFGAQQTNQFGERVIPPPRFIDGIPNGVPQVRQAQEYFEEAPSRQGGGTVPFGISQTVEPAYSMQPQFQDQYEQVDEQMPLGIVRRQEKVEFPLTPLDSEELAEEEARPDVQQGPVDPPASFYRSREALRDPFGDFEPQQGNPQMYRQRGQQWAPVQRRGPPFLNQFDMQSRSVGPYQPMQPRSFMDSEEEDLEQGNTSWDDDEQEEIKEKVISGSARPSSTRPHIAHADADAEGTQTFTDTNTDSTDYGATSSSVSITETENRKDGVECARVEEVCFCKNVERCARQKTVEACKPLGCLKQGPKCDKTYCKETKCRVFEKSSYSCVESFCVNYDSSDCPLRKGDFQKCLELDYACKEKVVCAEKVQDCQQECKEVCVEEN